MQEYLVMLAVLILAVVGHNMSVAYAAGAVLILKVLGLNQLLALFEAKGVSWGIIILTAAILVPLATGKITWEHLLHCLHSPAGIVAIAMGILVAIFGCLGVDYIKATPEVTTALIIGTMIGVFFFKGIPVGPLIAAGMVYCIMSVWGKIFG